jgi:hydrogenase-4 membrane subunit HyfE
MREGCDLGGGFTASALVFATALSFTTLLSQQRRLNLAMKLVGYCSIDALKDRVYTADISNC